MVSLRLTRIHCHEPAKDRKLSRLALNVLGVFEAVGLVIITLATLVAGVAEVKTMIEARTVTLADLLLLFLYLEILAMVGVYFRSGQLPVRFPITSRLWRWPAIWCST
jgi:protein PsiE